MDSSERNIIRSLTLRTLIVGLLIFHFTSLHGQTEQDTSRVARFTKYQAILKSFRDFVKQTSDLGINVFQPDYSQPGGGTPFKTATRLRADLKVESIRLGLKQYLEDGWYKAFVYYDNSNTTTRSKYTLDTKVEANRVVTIIFPDGGSLHTGPNNSEYAYSGGDLELDHEISGEIVRATTIVKISKRSAKLTYTVIIE